MPLLKSWSACTQNLSLSEAENFVDSDAMDSDEMAQVCEERRAMARSIAAALLRKQKSDEEEWKQKMMSQLTRPVNRLPAPIAEQSELAGAPVAPGGDEHHPAWDVQDQRAWEDWRRQQSRGYWRGSDSWPTWEDQNYYRSRGGRGHREPWAWDYSGSWRVSSGQRAPDCPSIWCSHADAGVVDCSQGEGQVGRLAPCFRHSRAEGHLGAEWG